MCVCALYDPCVYARAWVYMCVSVCVSKIQVLADYGENACYSKYGDYRDVDIPLEDLLHEYGASVELTLLKKQIGPNESNEKDRQTNRQADRQTQWRCVGCKCVHSYWAALEGRHLGYLG